MINGPSLTLPGSSSPTDWFASGVSTGDSSNGTIVDQTLAPLPPLPSTQTTQGSASSNNDILSQIFAGAQSLLNGNALASPGAPVSSATSQPLFNTLFGTPNVTVTPAPATTNLIGIGLALVAVFLMVLLLK